MTPDGGPLGRDAGGGWSPGRGWTPTGRAAASPRPSRSELSLFESAAPGGSATSAVSVKTLVEATRGVVEETLGALWVRGEVTDFKAHRNGQWYFALRDAGVQLRCVVWSDDRRRMPAAPTDGMAVAAFGQMTMYVARGDLQFRVSAIEPIGEGIHRLARDRTLALLKRDGLLAPERAPRPLPRYPRCVAVVTSLDGAALHDIVAVVRRRAPTVRVVVAPARVQGDDAPEMLCAALDRLSRWRGADVVIVGRGGGAKEDLSAFDDERVARAVAACAMPTVSAVGHELDVTLCDLVADHRAATPSAAAEAAVPLVADAEQRLRAAVGGLSLAARRRVERAQARMARVATAVRSSAARTTERRQARLESAAGRLQALSPLATLARGFAVAKGPGGEALTGAKDFTPGLPFDLVVRDGIVGAVTSRVAWATPEEHA